MLDLQIQDLPRIEDIVGVKRPLYALHDVQVGVVHLYGEVQRHLGHIDSQLDSCWSTIESLLKLAKMEEPRLERLDLISVACSGIAISRVPSTVKVIENFLEQEILVDGDREQLRMVFGNIATNAIQAMEGKGTLTVTVRRTADGQVSPNCR